MITESAARKVESDRDAEILERAAELFVRYGFRKTSMEDVARAADLSRQGLYLHYANKEALFTAALGRLIERALTVCRDALDDPGTALSERLLTAFVTMGGSADLAATVELLEAAQRRSMHLVVDVDAEIVAALANAIAISPIGPSWLERGIVPATLGRMLLNASYGLKYQRVDYDTYLAGMQEAISVVCGPMEGPIQ